MRFLRDLKPQYETSLLRKISALLRASSLLLSGLALLLPAPYSELSLVLLTVGHWVILHQMNAYCEHLEAWLLLTYDQQSSRSYRAFVPQKAFHRPH